VFNWDENTKLEVAVEIMAEKIANECRKEMLAEKNVNKVEKKKAEKISVNEGKQVHENEGTKNSSVENRIRKYENMIKIRDEMYKGNGKIIDELLSYEQER